MTGLLHYKPGAWLPLPRYSLATWCVVTLTCEHERLVAGPAHAWRCKAQAACFQCERILGLEYVTELPVIRANPLRLQ